MSVFNDKGLDDKVLFVYNPYVRRLTAYFMDHDFQIEESFEEECEWIKISHPAHEDQYLHIQLDYDECAQLIVYYRRDNDQELNEGISDSWNSTSHRSSNIFIAENDMQERMFIENFPNITFYKGVKEIVFKGEADE